jgi:hypothetical protein
MLLSGAVANQRMVADGSFKPFSEEKLLSMYLDAEQLGFCFYHSAVVLTIDLFAEDTGCAFTVEWQITWIDWVVPCNMTTISPHVSSISRCLMLSKSGAPSEVGGMTS